MRIRLGNRDLGTADFRWLDAREVKSDSYPKEALVLEREEWGRFYGFPVAVRRAESVVVDGSEEVVAALPGLLRQKRAERSERIDPLREEIREQNRAIDARRLAKRDTAELQADYERSAAELQKREAEFAADVLVMRTADGREQPIALGKIVRAIP